MVIHWYSLLTPHDISLLAGLKAERRVCHKPQSATQKPKCNLLAVDDIAGVGFGPSTVSYDTHKYMRSVLAAGPQNTCFVLDSITTPDR